jgi:hypothetical protein
LFHAGNALGVLPSGLLPLVGYATLSGRLTLLPLGAKVASVKDAACVTLHGRCPSAELWHHRLQGFAPRQKPFRKLAVLPARSGRCPPGLSFPSRAFSPSATKASLKALSSHALCLLRPEGLRSRGSRVLVHREIGLPYGCRPLWGLPATVPSFRFGFAPARDYGFSSDPWWHRCPSPGPLRTVRAPCRSLKR